MITPTPPSSSSNPSAFPDDSPALPSQSPPPFRVAYGVKWTPKWTDQDIEKFLKGLAYFLTERVSRQLRESRKKRKELFYRYYR